MAKLRKILGDVNAPVTVALMQLIETQSGTTLASWALSFVEENVLPFTPRLIQTILPCARLLMLPRGMWQAR